MSYLRDSEPRPVTVNNRTIGLPTLLTVLFVGLKLTGYISWSWWWVLSPLWIGFLLWIVIVAFILGIAVWADSR